MTDSTLTLEKAGEVSYSPGARVMDGPAAGLPEQARSRIGALVGQISSGAADYGLVPLKNLAAVARVVPADRDHPRSIALEVCPTTLLEGEISAEAIGGLAQALRDPVSKLALFANLVTHGPADRRAYYEATLSAEIRSLAKLIDQLSRLAGMMSSTGRPVDSQNLDRLATVVRDEAGLYVAEGKLPLVATHAPDQSVHIDGRLVGEAVQNVVAAFPVADPACDRVEVDLAVDGDWLVVRLAAPAFEISVNDLAERFEPFFGGSINLGPVLARIIVARHDGFITVKDNGAGGVMSLWLAVGDGRNPENDMN